MRLVVFLVFCSALTSLSLGAQEFQLSKPVINVSENGFFDRFIDVLLDFRLEGSSLYYTLDGSEPTESSARYKKPLRFRKNGWLKVKAFKEGFLPSETVSSQFTKVNRLFQSIEIAPQAKPPYDSNGGPTLNDLSAGSLNFRDGKWLGYNEGPIHITINLGTARKSKEILLSMLSSPNSWIMPPSSIQMASSKDGINYGEPETKDIKTLQNGDTSGKVYYSFKLNRNQAPYIKLTIHPLSKLPNWHPGKGNPAWVFLDEIIVR